MLLLGFQLPNRRCIEFAWETRTMSVCKNVCIPFTPQSVLDIWESLTLGENINKLLGIYTQLHILFVKNTATILPGSILKGSIYPQETQTNILFFLHPHQCLHGLNDKYIVWLKHNMIASVKIPSVKWWHYILLLLIHEAVNIRWINKPHWTYQHQNSKNSRAREYI